MKVAIPKKRRKNPPAMPVKPDDEKNDAAFQFRCKKRELEMFKRAAEREGFRGNISAWLLYHLCRIAKEGDEREK